jgi:hypothetical protein
MRVRWIGTAAVLLLAACPADAPEGGHMRDPLPDTAPVIGTGADLPEGVPLPPRRDTLPPR